MTEIIHSIDALAHPAALEPLSERERREIEAEMPHYPMPRAVTIEALKIVQKHCGWVSDGKVKAIAELLQVSPAEVDGVATFYNKIYRKPVGKTVLALCDSVSCWILGCSGIMRHACQVLAIQPGQTTADGRFTLLPTPCLGACDKGPAMMFGDDLVEQVDADRFDELIR